MIILVPILIPVLNQFQIDLTHFGIVLLVNLTIGQMTPPVGVLLFVASSVAQGAARAAGEGGGAVRRGADRGAAGHHLCPGAVAVAAAGAQVAAAGAPTASAGTEIASNLDEDRNHPRRRQPPDAVTPTIRLHPADDVVIARHQLISGARIGEEGVTASGLIPAGPQDGGAAHRRRPAGEALQPDHRRQHSRHRAGPARAHPQSGDGRIRARLCLLGRRPSDAGGAAAGHLRRHREARRAGGDAQLHRHPHQRQLLGHGGARHRATTSAATSIPRRWPTFPTSTASSP